jgi:hypothetical protein
MSCLKCDFMGHAIPLVFAKLPDWLDEPAFGLCFDLNTPPVFNRGVFQLLD